MTRPDRYKYVRKLLQPKTCVFCDAAESEVGEEFFVLWKTRHSMAVLNKFPYNSGHILVLPLLHKGTISDLSKDEYSDLNQVLKISVHAIEKVYGVKGLNIGMNHGEVAGAGIPAHLHWHVIPRWLGDTNFFPIIAETKVLAETLEQSFAKLQPAIQELARDVQ